MILYSDKEKLLLKNSIGVTDEVKALVEREKKRLHKQEGRKLSRSKIICNLVIEKYGNA